MTEPGIARTVVGSVPVGTTLVVSSSMPVRDVEWWSRPREGLRVLANRGANGIDGVVSTALGVAAALAPGAGPSAAGGRAVALIGDLAFVYDAGALLWAAERELDLDIVVMDNDGGGIFSFLPQAGSQPAARFERLWGTPHGVDLCSLARSYGSAAESVPDLGSLAQAVARPARRGARVLVAKVDRSADVHVQQRLHRAVATAVADLA
jgi:2-succinyl-5-enolpyruvyl-6-hydroxy-3-cyclohexene-1-carboxylate synthase